MSLRGACDVVISLVPGKPLPFQRDCFTAFAMTAIKWDFNGRAAFTITRPLENGKMNGYRIKSGMTKGEIKKGSGEPLWKQFNLLWLGG